MSHIRWIPPPAGRPPKRSAWRCFPWIVALAMGVVVAVNAGLIYAALASFPGKAAGDGFDLSNHYDVVLDHAQQEAALGWTMKTRADAAGRREVAIADRSGAPLRGASVAALAQRPLGARETRHLVLREAAPGRYVADDPLAMRGQWDLTLSISAGGHDVAATRRIIVQ